MSDLKNTILNRILPRVQKPGQYAGGERNMVEKDHAGVDLTVALAFPDTYAVGMSHLGSKILYHILNGRDDVAAERVFAPWLDMEEALKKHALPLYSLETFAPLGEFDVIGFSIQYELCFTNMLNMLELGGIPLETNKRSTGDPIIIGGGSMSLAMEPLAPFFDAILVGDAEDVIHPLVNAIIAWKKSGMPRGALHEALTNITGIYVPAFYNVEYHPDNTIKWIKNIPPAPLQVPKITVENLNTAPFPTRPVVPNVEVIHDRINVEIMRGCPHQCRFCQAVKHYRPLKIRSPERVTELCEEIFKNTGYNEISLTSLSTADYPGILDLVADISKRFDSRKVNIALPSLRVGQELKHLPSLTTTVRKSGLTLAPEAATDRLRKIIRKQITNEDLLDGCEAAFQSGYRLLKLYYMIGLPTETDDDICAIAELTERISLLRKNIKGGRANINASISCHVPKPHTPFQWEAMNSRDEFRAKQGRILSLKRSRAIRYKFHGAEESYLEAVFARGDRRLANVLLKARERGIRMDGWSECFDKHAWAEVFEETGIDPDFYALRKRGEEEVLPWDHMLAHTSKDYLLKEKGKIGAFGA
jgi:radical SAM family uncharacterized protein